MREQVRDRGRLEHILQAIDKVFEFTKDVKREDFKKDSILYFAIVKNIEIIGEASYMLSLDLSENTSSPQTSSYIQDVNCAFIREILHLSGQQFKRRGRCNQ